MTLLGFQEHRYNSTIFFYGDGAASGIKQQSSHTLKSISMTENRWTRKLKSPIYAGAKSALEDYVAYCSAGSSFARVTELWNMSSARAGGNFITSHIVPILHGK